MDRLPGPCRPMTDETMNSPNTKSAATIDEHQVVHRTLDDESGQDYFVYLPQGVDKRSRNTPVLVVVHDISRNPQDQVDVFARTSDQYGAIVVAPNFATDRYPNYQRLGRSRNKLDRGRRADEALDAILVDVEKLSGASTEKVYLFGYAAGARFALRYAMAHPGRVAGVVIAAADSYTFPDRDKRFPQGIAPGQKRSDLIFEPAQFLCVPMTVLVANGEHDGGSGPRLEQVGRPPKSSPRNKSRLWVRAMRESAALHELDSLVGYQELEASLESFESFVDQSSLSERVLEILLGALPGQSAKFAEQTPVEDKAEVANALSEGEGDDALTGASGWGRIRRLVLPVIAVVALIAIAAPIAMWVHYRSTHVVSRDAVVRSHIADVGARMDGVVKSVEVDAGDRVHAGQVVATLEASHIEARVRQASSRLEKAQRELEVERLAIENERLRLESSLQEFSAGLSAASAEADVSESRVQEAMRRLELQQKLASQGLVAEERVRMAETELRTARALAAASTAQRRAALAGEDVARVAADGLAVREKRISVIESDIATFHAELAVANANLESTIIRAPDDGAVVRRIVQPGGSAGVGQPIISLWVGEEIWVEAWLDEDDLGQVPVGSRATVTFKSYPDREFSGVVQKIGVSTDIELPDSEVPQPRRERMRDAPVISVRVDLDEPADDLFPGLSATVGIEKGSN